MQDQHSRVEEIFSHALAQSSAAGQAAYLNEACGNDAELRQRVEALLATHHADAGGFLDLPHIDQPASPPVPLSEGPGSKIGRYKLLQQIGEGGFGVVFMAEQEHPVRRRVALKIIKLGMDTRQVVARFEAERQALAMMEHPNIARVLDGGATETGRPYFVMELVKGIPITQYCDEHHLTPRDRLALFISVCHAVQHAHQKGIIHRDLKPSNVLIAEYDERPVAKVIDFGVAKAVGQQLTEKTMFTAFGQVIGTMEYMSPEHAKLNQLDIDTRSDIYSLGVILYELLTGQTPFDRKRLQSAAFDEMLRIIREEEPLNPSTQVSRSQTLPSVAANRHTEPAKLTRLIHGELDWIVMKSLEKDRSRRYETASVFAADVQRYLDDEAVQACPPSAGYRLRKFIRRNKLAFVAGTIVAAALIVGLTASIWMFIRERQAHDRAVAAEQVQSQLRYQADVDKKKAQTEAAKSRQTALFLKDMLSGVGPYVAVGRDTALLRDILDKTAERVSKDLKDQPEVEAELLEIMGYVYSEIGPIDKAETMLRKSLAIRSALPGDHRLEVASSLHALSLALWRQGRLPETETALSEALGIRRNLLPEGSWELPNTLRNLGGVLTLLGKLAEAETLEREAVQLSRSRNDDWGAVWGLNFLSHALGMQGKLVEAESTARESVLTAKRLPGTAPPMVAESLRFLGYALHWGHKLAEAETALREALTEFRKVSDNERSLPLAWTLDELAAVLTEQGNRGEAEDLLRESLAIKRKVLGNENPDTLHTLRPLIDALRQMGKLDEAEKLNREAPAPATVPSATTQA